MLAAALLDRANLTGVVLGCIEAKGNMRLNAFEALRKVNQIGSVTESIEACKLSQEQGPQLRCHVALDLRCWSSLPFSFFFLL